MKCDLAALFSLTTGLRRVARFARSAAACICTHCTPRTPGPPFTCILSISRTSTRDISRTHRCSSNATESSGDPRLLRCDWSPAKREAQNYARPTGSIGDSNGRFSPLVQCATAVLWRLFQRTISSASPHQFAHFERGFWRQIQPRLKRMTQRSSPQRSLELFPSQRRRKQRGKQAIGRPPPYVLLHW